MSSTRDSNVGSEEDDTTTLRSGNAAPIVIDEEARSEKEKAARVATEPLADAAIAPDPDITEKMRVAKSTEPSPERAESSLHPMLLERIEPSLERGERLRLDAAHPRVSLGRAEQCDVRLYSASASREHAMIAQNGAGEWVLTVGAGKSVMIDGEITKDPVVLEVGMNLILGQDHLRCVTESLDRAGMKAQTAVDGLDETLAPRFFALRRWAKRLRLEWWMLGLGIGIGMALGLVFMARG